MQAGELKLTAIVTRATPYGESDMIITLVGVDGKVTATARGCLKKGAKLRYAAEPMNFGDYVLACKNGRYTVIECSQIESFSEVTSDIDRYYAAFLALDVLSRLSEERGMLALTLKALDELAHSDKDADDVVRDFLLMTLALGGNTLDFGVCNVCGLTLDEEAYFKESDGIVCKHCRGEGAIVIDAASRSYLDGGETSHSLRLRANKLLCDLIYNMLGIKINAEYFVERV